MCQPAEMHGCYAEQEQQGNARNEQPEATEVGAKVAYPGCRNLDPATVGIDVVRHKRFGGGLGAVIGHVGDRRHEERRQQQHAKVDEDGDPDREPKLRPRFAGAAQQPESGQRISGEDFAKPQQGAVQEADRQQPRP